MDDKRIVVACWHCHGRLRLPVGKVGRVVCPHPACGKSFWVNTARRPGPWQKIELAARNDGKKWAGWVLLGALILWPPFLAAASPRGLNFWMGGAAAGSALLLFTIDRKHFGVAPASLVASARVFFATLAVMGLIFGTIQAVVAPEPKLVTVATTKAALEAAMQQLNRWVIGWLPGGTGVNFGLALAFVVFLFLFAVVGRKAWMRTVAAAIFAFLLCGAISDAAFQARRHELALALQQIAHDYSLLRREIAGRLMFLALPGNDAPTPAAADELPRLVQRTLDTTVAQAVSKAVEYRWPDALRAGAESGHSSTEASALERSLSPDAAAAVAAVEQSSRAQPDVLSGFSLAPFFQRYGGFSNSWQHTRDTLFSLAKAPDDWQPGFATLDARLVPAEASVAGVERCRTNLSQYLGPVSAPRDDVRAAMVEGVEAQCSPGAAPLLAALLLPNNLDFLSAEVQAATAIFQAESTEKYLTNVGTLLLRGGDPRQIKAIMAGFPNSPPVQAFRARCRALEAQTRADCAKATEAARGMDAEIRTRVEAEFPEYLQKFGVFLQARLGLPEEKKLGDATASVFGRLRARLQAEKDPLQRFHLLSGWVSQINSQPARSTQERYELLSRLEQKELRTEALSTALRSRAAAQEAATRWGELRQRLFLDLTSGRGVLGAGRDAPLRGLLERWHAQAADLAPQVYLMGNGDWETEFAAGLTDLKQAVAWGAAIVTATNFAAEVHAAVLARGQWLATNDTTLTRAAAGAGAEMEYRASPENFQGLPALPEDGYLAYTAMLHPSRGRLINVFSRLDLNEESWEEGYMNAPEYDCGLLVYHEVGFQKMVMARYPIHCPASLGR
jgi:hypothetical protein